LAEIISPDQKETLSSGVKYLYMKKKETNGQGSAKPKADYVVGIGASAGGLEALQEFFKAVPLNTGIAYVVIQHLSPDYKSLMDELLARYTRLAIKKAKDGMLVEPDTIYLIPPRNNLSIFHGKLVLEDQGSRSGLNLPIDIFFRSLAADVGKKSIGIILSGTGSDGTLGTRAIKEAGGMVMAQDERTARFDGMPRSSISTGLVDYILPPGKMPEELVNYIKHPFTEKSNQAAPALTSSEDTLTRVLLVLREFSGIDFSYYKENTILRRLERRLSINRFERLDDYLKLLIESDKEKDILYRELLIGVTRFFRDEAAFALIKNSVLPRLLDSGNKQLRIWSVACSTGEEVYSLGLIIKEFIEEHNLDCDVKIFATDIDRHSLELAGQAIYPESIVGDIEPRLLAKYFIRRENGYQVTESIRKMAIFATHNVLKDPPFSKLDMIVCRNLFIYFKPESQSKVIGSFYMALKPGGILFMGSSETLGTHTDAFNTVNSKHKIYAKKQGYSQGFPHDLTASINYLADKQRTPGAQFNIRQPRRDVITEKIFNTMLPPSLVLDEQQNILQVINDINPFVKLKPGKFSNNLNSIISPELSMIISNIYRRLKSSSEKVIFENVRINQDDELVKLDVEGRLIMNEDDQKVYLVSFLSRSVEKIDTGLKQVINIEAHYQDQLSELQHELQFTKENLQATVEELETSNEELQASNEELIASNEELQSTNEELQSVNEELYTVNSEFQSKIEELTQLNNDVNNLLNNTEIAAIYLDSKLCIRKFTASFAELSSLMDLDIGRPITQFSAAFVYKDFLKDIEYVRKTLVSVEKEIEASNGVLYFLKIVPYRTDYHAVDGVLVTMLNISGIKEERRKHLKASFRLQQALEMGNMAWWEWSLETGNVEMHEKKATMLGYSFEEFPKNVYKICEFIHPDDYEYTMQNMRDHLEGKTDSYNVVYRIKTKTGGYKWYYDRGGVVERTSEGRPLKVVGLVVDVSEFKELEQKLGENQ
jgi:two-component system CheB/CheR fusion protein